MVEKVFEEIKLEAQRGIVNLKDDGVDIPVRICFSFDTTIEGTPKFLINDVDKFTKVLTEYVYCALNFYSLEPIWDNIKIVLTHVWSNITLLEMNCAEDYLMRRISFFNCDITQSQFSKSCSLGEIFGVIVPQSIQQETPYCFKSMFRNGDDVYALPRISFGIENGVCYIYAIQNKDTSTNTNNPIYNEAVQRTIRSINSGVKQYRNVTPSFVVALTYFTSILNSYGIDKIEVLSPLPLRQENKKRVNEYVLEYKTMKGDLSLRSVEVLKKELEEKRIRDDYNATEKFRTCFNRLKVHFNGIHLDYNAMTNKMVLDVLELSTTQPFLQQIVASESYNMLK